MLYDLVDTEGTERVFFIHSASVCHPDYASEGDLHAEIPVTVAGLSRADGLPRWISWAGKPRPIYVQDLTLNFWVRVLS